MHHDHIAPIKQAVWETCRAYAQFLEAVCLARRFRLVSEHREYSFVADNVEIVFSHGKLWIRLYGTLYEAPFNLDEEYRYKVEKIVRWMEVAAAHLLPRRALALLKFLDDLTAYLILYAAGRRRAVEELLRQQRFFVEAVTGRGTFEPEEYQRCAEEGIRHTLANLATAYQQFRTHPLSEIWRLKHLYFSRNGVRVEVLNAGDRVGDVVIREPAVLFDVHRNVALLAKQRYQLWGSCFWCESRCAQCDMLAKVARNVIGSLVVPRDLYQFAQFCKNLAAYFRKRGEEIEDASR